MASPSPVETRVLAPTDEVDDSPQRLYRPIKNQLTVAQAKLMVMEPVMVTQETATELLIKADQNPAFRQRKRLPGRVSRWLGLIQTDRFVHFSPEGAVLLDPDGFMLNGGNRMEAVRQHDEPVGMMLIHNVPSWFVQYFDQGNNRSKKEALYMMNRPSVPETIPLARVAMRFEEFLLGKRDRYGWVLWGKVRDENPDIDDFITRRTEIFDWIPVGKQVRKGSELMTVSAAAFVAYQKLAWPEGSDEVDAFLDGLIYGANIAKGNPALTLREWGRKDGYIGNGSSGRREGHLLLLLNFFASFVNKSYVDKVLVAKGFPMAMPYHPDGHEIALKNIREALTQMDAEAEATPVD